MSTTAPLEGVAGTETRTPERAWRIERGGWVLMVLIMLAATLGVFAEGPLSWSTMRQSSTGVVVDYERLVRRGGPTGLSITVPAEHAGGGTIALWIDENYLNDVRIDNISPTPDSVTAEGGGLLYEFAVGSTTNLNVSISLQPDAIGWRTIRLGLPDHPTLEAWQFMYP